MVPSLRQLAGLFRRQEKAGTRAERLEREYNLIREAGWRPGLEWLRASLDLLNRYDASGEGGTADEAQEHQQD